MGAMNRDKMIETEFETTIKNGHCPYLIRGIGNQVTARANPRSVHGVRDYPATTWECSG